MKKMIFMVVLIFLGVGLYSQSWVIQGEPSNDTEFIVITSEQFERIIQAQQTVARTVIVEYQDYMVFMNAIRSLPVIRGTIPNFNGYFYLTSRMIPKNDDGRFFSQITSAWVMYGNTRTNSIMSIRFFNLDEIPNALSLRRDWNEYVRQYNRIVRLVNGE